MASTTDRGYDYAHKVERERWRPIVDRGEAHCCEDVCLEPTRLIQPGTPWDLAHTTDRTGYKGPSHARCNRSEGIKRRMHGETQTETNLRW